MMIVDVYINDIPYSVSVGSGKQTIKWLALNIESKFRENINLRNQYHVDIFRVYSMKNENGEILNPKDRIFEHTPDNGKLIVRTEVCQFVNFVDFCNS